MPRTATRGAEVSKTTLLDTSSRTTLEDQLIVDALPCGAYGGKVASRWCGSRILNTSSSGLITASASKQFGPRLWIQVDTYHPTASTPAMVGVVVAATKYGLTFAWSCRGLLSNGAKTATKATTNLR